MTSAEMARAYLAQAALILEEAERHRQAGAWHLAVRRAQESVERALKAVLRAAAVEVPRVHDVGVFLRQAADRLPKAVVEELDRLVSISRRLRGEREVAFYGDEAVGAPPEQLYTAADAAEALADARFVLDRCRAAVPPAG
ncbi:MAG TPA: HEPN domain-containing protein [Candidatus Binatia bacterium]|nr:HEPN domain-containing protein [Candidatus Binatia bacterium]